MKVLSIFILFVLSLTGCATGFTPASGDGMGYKVTRLKTPHFYTHSASYIGNAQTRTDQAEAYTEMAAINFCTEKSQLPIMMRKSIDLTKRYRGTEVSSIGNQVYSYPTLKTYPAYMNFFRCDKDYRVLSQNPEFKSLSAQLMKDHVDDFKGALQVVRTSGATGLKALKANDVIISVDGLRVVNALNLYHIIASTKEDKVNLEILRSKKKKKLEVKLVSKMDSNMKTVEGKIRNFCDLKTSVEDESDLKNCVAKYRNKMVY